MFKNRSVAVLVMAILMLVPPTVAFASNVHQVTVWEHGLGDGWDYDYILHPYMHEVNGVKRPASAKLKRSNGAGNDPTTVWSASATTNHLHRTWDTNPKMECIYWARLSSSSVTYPLNWHNHYHHDGFCG